MNELLHRHLVVRRLGAGTFVTDDPLEQNRRLKIGFFSTVSPIQLHAPDALRALEHL